MDDYCSNYTISIKLPSTYNAYKHIANKDITI